MNVRDLLFILSGIGVATLTSVIMFNHLESKFKEDITKNIEELVSKRYEKEAKTFRVDFNLSDACQKIDSGILKELKFKPENDDNSYLTTKVGFLYQLDDTEKEKKIS